MGFIFLVLFLGVAWVFAIALRAQVSGWAALARHYRYSDQEAFGGSTWNRESARFRHMTLYRGYLTVGVETRGLYLQVAGAYRLRHPPLLIPWSDIRAREPEKATTADQEPDVALELGMEPRIPFLISKDLARKLRFVAGMSWPMQDESSAG